MSAGRNQKPALKSQKKRQASHFVLFCSNFAILNPYSATASLPCFATELSLSSDEGRMSDDGLTTYFCAYCGQPNETFVDISAGTKQRYVEDCAVCCRPNVLSISIDEESGEILIESEFEG